MLEPASLILEGTLIVLLEGAPQIGPLIRGSSSKKSHNLRRLMRNFRVVSSDVRWLRGSHSYTKAITTKEPSNLRGVPSNVR